MNVQRALSNLLPLILSTGIPGKNGIDSVPGGGLIVPDNLLKMATLSPHKIVCCLSNLVSGMKVPKAPVILLNPSLFGPVPVGFRGLGLTFQSGCMVSARRESF